MPLHAVEDVGDAVEATQAFLLPMNRSRWLRLALIVLFVGGGLGVQFPANVSTSTSPDLVQSDSGSIQVDGPPSDLPGPLSPDTVLLVVGVVVAAAVLLALLFGFVGAVMSFVFVESLRRDEVRIRPYFRQHWRAGLRLFGFRLGVSLLGLALVATLVATLALAVFGGVPTDPQPAQVLGSLLVVVPLFALVFAVVGLVNGFTTAFVVPVMLAEDLPVLAGWRRFWPTLRGQLKQYGAYVLMGFLLTVAVGIIAATAVGIGAVVLAIPFLVLGAIVFLAGGTQLSLAVGAGLVVLALLYVAALVALIALIQVPLRTFLRLYTLFVLGDTNEAFDLIPEMRAEVRA